MLNSSLLGHLPPWLRLPAEESVYLVSLFTEPLLYHCCHNGSCRSQQGLTGPSTGACHLCRRACSTEKVSYLLHVWMMWPHGCDSLLNVCLMYPMCLSWYSYLFKIPMVSLCFKLHDRCHFRLHLNKIEIICRHRHFCYFVRDNTTDILFEVKTG